MRLLIDTQIFIWALLDSENLNVQARNKLYILEKRKQK